jgi:hypothetical protein
MEEGKFCVEVARSVLKNRSACVCLRSGRIADDDFKNS